jgi:hypothetical protein
MTRSDAKRILGPAVVLAGWILNSPHGSAQAWLPAKGEGTVSISFQHVNAAGHFLEDGSRLPGYQTRASNLIFEVAYGLTERLAVNVSLPYMNTKYTGKDEPLNLPENVLDDGRYHRTVQDFRSELRCNALRRPFMATPFFAAIIPSHDYKTIGEAAAGRHLREYLVGAYAGRLLNPVLRRAYVHGLYSYAFVERDVNIPLNRSNVELAVGYLVTPSLPLSFIWKRQWTHGGLDFAELFEAPPEVFRNMDRVTRQNFQHVGVGAGFPLSKSMSVHVNFVKLVSGANAHYGTGISAGVSWSFQTRRERPGPSASLAPINRTAFLN